MSASDRSGLCGNAQGLELFRFAGNAQLRGNAASNLNKLAKFMRPYPDMRVLIEGHTDNAGSAAYDQRLSQQRAESVEKHLIQNGIASGRIAV